MTSPRRVLVVGAGLAGAKAVEALRQAGFDGSVTLVGREAERPYDRPPLSKDFLRGELPRERVFVHPAGFYEENKVELRTGTEVTELDLDGGVATAVTADGRAERFPFDALVLSTGSAPRRLPLPGADLEGVHLLREIEDSERLHEAIAHASRVVVIGAGWIGCEVAASARQMGVDVDLVDVARLPLERQLGPEIAALYRDLHADHGVALHLSTGVEAIRGSGRAEEVVLADGTRLAADVVVVGVGAVPHLELAVAAGLETGDGVLVDRHLQASHPAVYCAGDIAAVDHPVVGTRLRLEHWSGALNQGPVAARNLLGANEDYVKVPYFYSDQYDFGMEFAGHAASYDEVVFRGDPGGRKFIAFFLDAGRVVAAMNANVWDVTDDLQRLVASHARPPREKLVDPEVELASLLPPPDRQEGAP